VAVGKKNKKNNIESKTQTRLIALPCSSWYHRRMQLL